jgi:hypothetical protein
MENLKKKVQEILAVNTIDFDLQYHHKGHFITITGADEIKSNLENWIGYEALIQYLIGKDILYNFSGSFELNEGDILIYVSFTGPYEDEFEPVELPIESIFFDDDIERDLKSVISMEINYSELFIKFGFDETQDFNYLEIYYWDENSNDIQLTEKLTRNSINYIRNFIKMFLNNNVPRLNLPREIEQDYYAECEENTIRYYINSSHMVIEWDAVEN